MFLLGFALSLFTECQEVDSISLQKRSQRSWPACKTTGGVILTDAFANKCSPLPLPCGMYDLKMALLGEASDLRFTFYRAGTFYFSAGQTRVEASSHPSEMEDFSRSSLPLPRGDAAAGVADAQATRLACWHIRGSVLMRGGNPSCRPPHPAIPFSVEHVEFFGTVLGRRGSSPGQPPLPPGSTEERVEEQHQC